jgi:hypothetical protein
MTQETKIEKYDDDEYVEEQMEQARERGLFKNLRFKNCDVYHVYPIGDLREHSTDGGACWCAPRTEPGIVIHNSMDGREFYETGERKMQ